MLAHYLTSFLKKEKKERIITFKHYNINPKKRKEKKKKKKESIHPLDFVKMNYQLKYLFPSELRNKKNDKHVMINIYI